MARRKKKPLEPRLPWPGEVFLDLRAYALCEMEKLDQDCCKIGPIEKKARREEWRTIEHWLKLTYEKIERAQAPGDPHGLDKMTTRLRAQVGDLAFGWMERLAT